MISPEAPGYWISAPKMSCSAASAAGATIISKPNISARCLTTSIVCGKTSSEIKKRFDFLFLETRLASAMASAAAVPSSNNEAEARSKPVRSIHICW